MTNEPLVCLPGMMCDGRLFAPQIARFSSQRPFMVVPPIGADSIIKLALRLLAVAPPRFALAGLSLGGIVAMEIVKQEPDRVTRLALLDTNPLPDPPEKAEIRRRQIQNVRRGELRAVMRDEMKPNYLAQGPATEKTLSLCMDMAEALGPGVFENQSNALQNRPDQCATLPAIAVPTLILCGQEDRLCPVERHELMHDMIGGSHMVVVRGAGHLPTLEQPERTNEALCTWLNT